MLPDQMHKQLAKVPPASGPSSTATRGDIVSLSFPDGRSTVAILGGNLVWPANVVWGTQTQAAESRCAAINSGQ
jgi:hypothetical protein